MLIVWLYFLTNVARTWLNWWLLGYGKFTKPRPRLAVPNPHYMRVYHNLLDYIDHAEKHPSGEPGADRLPGPLGRNAQLTLF